MSESPLSAHSFICGMYLLVLCPDPPEDVIKGASGLFPRCPGPVTHSPLISTLALVLL